MTIVRTASWPVRAQAELELRRRRALAEPSAPAPPPDPGPIFRPDSIPQDLFDRSTADITIIGGSVFGGKTWSLTFEPTKHLQVPGFTSVTFRRVTPEIRNPGGIWIESMGMYPYFSGTPKEHQLEWDFASGAKVKFAGLQHDKDVLDWKSSQICLLQFDQLEEFTAAQFWYMLSRNRSMCGVRPYVRASCNPDPDSFLAEFLAWWIDPESGYAIPERSGQVRWFVRLMDDELAWADSKADLVDRYPELGTHAQSVSFVLARLQDNRIGNTKDPQYLSRMRAMPRVEQERLLGGDRGGNWKIRAAAGLVFNRAWFEIVDVAPARARKTRGWDNAATAGGGDWTVGTRMSELNGIYYVEDVIRKQCGPDARKQLQRTTAEADGKDMRIRGEQEPGSSGVDAAAAFVKNLNGFTVHAYPSTGSKVVRAGALASQVQAGNVKLIRAEWNEGWLRRMDAFPTANVPDDEVDSAVLAYEELARPIQSTDSSDYRTVRR